MAVIKHPSAATGGGDWADDLGTGAEIDGVASFKGQSLEPSATANYAKIYAVKDEVPKLGTGQIKLDGDSDYFRVAYDAANADFDFGTGDFTIEGFVKWNEASRGTELWSIGLWNANGVEFIWSPNKFILYVASVTIDTGADTFTPVVGTWYHVAISRDSSDDCRIFVNGTQVGSTAGASGSVDGNAGTFDGFKIGTESSGAAKFPGYFDEIRVSNSCRYAANFSTPTAAFSNDGNTVALYHCDDGNGATTLVDSSSNSQHMTAVGTAIVSVSGGTGGTLFVLDSDGNGTKLSSHDDDGEWEYYSKNQKTGKVVRINMEECIRDLGQLTGKDYIKDE